MITSYAQVFTIIAQTAGIFLLLYLLMRKYIFSFFDPLCFFLITQAFSVELAFIIIQDPNYLLNFLCCQLIFYVGFLSAAKKIKAFDFKDFQGIEFNPLTYSSLKIFVWLGFVVAGLLNLYLISKKGIALFADDPSAAKTENFSEGGLGIIRRINWGILYVIILSSLFLYMINRKLVYLLITLMLLGILLISGSKGALLYFVFLIPLLRLLKPLFGTKMLAKLNRAKYIILILSLILTIIILIAGSSDKSGELAFYNLTTRFLFFGDAILYYYNPYAVKFFSQYHPVDYLIDEFNSLFGFFRLVPYNIPLGFKLVSFQQGVDSVLFGPNVPYYIKGYIYFGKWGVLAYSWLVGWTVGFVRSKLLTVLVNPADLLYCIALIHLNLIIFNLPQDSQLFMSVLFDTLIFFVALYSVAGFISWSILRKKNPLLKFSNRFQ